MTLDVLDFIDSKGGKAEAIRESQKKRFGSKPEAVKLVDDVVRMYAEWVKMDYEVNQINKEINAIKRASAQRKRPKRTQMTSSHRRRSWMIRRRRK